MLGKAVGGSLEAAACLVRELAGPLARRAQRAAGGHEVKDLLEPHGVESPLVEQRVTLAVSSGLYFFSRQINGSVTLPLRKASPMGLTVRQRGETMHAAVLRN